MATQGSTGEKKTTVTTVEEKSVVDIVSDKINALKDSGRLDLPKNYSLDNALKSAYLTLNTVEDKNHNHVMKDGKLTGIVTKASIANAILDMVIQGLNPSKKQCYFIVYGNTLTLRRSYFGSMAVANMVNPLIKDWGYNVVYEGDTFKYGIHNGKAFVMEHIQDLANIDKAKIIAAYAMALDKDGKSMRTEIMTIEEIHQAWSMSATSPFDADGGLKESSTHGKFTRDMALRTVINKVAKYLINDSSDNALLLERINRAEDIADAATVQAEIAEKANAGSMVMFAEEPTQIENKKDAGGDKEATKGDAPKVEGPEKQGGEQVRRPDF